MTKVQYFPVGNSIYQKLRVADTPGGHSRGRNIIFIQSQYTYIVFLVGARVAFSRGVTYPEGVAGDWGVDVTADILAYLYLKEFPRALPYVLRFFYWTKATCRLRPVPDCLVAFLNDGGQEDPDCTRIYIYARLELLNCERRSDRCPSPWNALGEALDVSH